jgi:glucose-1-phosphate thymidylyltransferase
MFCFHPVLSDGNKRENSFMDQPLLGLILAGGRGTRFGELTTRIPKPLLPVAGKPLIVRNIENLRRAGITQITIVISPDSEQVRTVLGDGSELGVNLNYVVQNDHLGTAHAIGLAREVLDGRRFLVCWSDNLTLYQLSDLVDNDRVFPADGTLAVHFTDNPKKGGIVITRAREVIEFEEKPEKPRSNLNMAGMYILGPWVFDAIDRTKLNAKEGEYYLPDAFQIAVDGGRTLHWALVGDWRMNVNTPEDLLLGNARLLEQDGNVTRSANDCTIMKPVHIPASVQLNSGSTIGPYVSMGERVVVGENARIADAIVLDDAVIPDGAEIDRAIVDVDGTVYPAQGE